MSTPWTPRVLARLAPIALVAFLLAAPVPAVAGEGYVPGASWDCIVEGGGGRDAQGTLYSPCYGNTISMRSKAGVPLGTAKIPSTSGIKSVNSIAPTPDGSAIYTVDFDQGNAAGLGMSLQRLKFNADRSALTLDTTFRPQRFTAGGKQYDVCGFDIATDMYGFIYVSQGGWCYTRTSGADRYEPNMILKYAPDGKLVTQFGTYGTSGKLGELFVNMGIAVSPDGRRVYVAEHSARRVQYFDWSNGVYKPTGAIGGVTVAGSPTQFSSVYDVDLDPWGMVYVADTTSATVWKTTASGAYVAKVMRKVGDASDPWPVIHAISVDARGDVLVPKSRAVFQRASDNPYPSSTPPVGPQPKDDVAAPMLRGISGPARTAETSITVTLDAVDDVGVTQMRFATESGNWGAWQAFTTSARVQLSSGYGYKLVLAQVRDVREAESAVLQLAVVRAEVVVADTTAPVLRVSAPSTVSVQAPVARVAVTATDAVGVTHYRVAREDGAFGDWIAMGRNFTGFDVDLAGAPGYRALTVQVRDASYNISDAAFLSFTVVDPNARPADDAPTVIPPVATPDTPNVVQPPTAAPPVGGGAGGGPIPVRDAIAPRLLALMTPTRSCLRSIVITLRASDNVGVKQVRVANEDGRYGAWRAFTPKLRHQLTAGAKTKRITVQVRDAAGNVSTARSQRLVLKRCR